MALSVSWGSDARYLTSHAEEGRERDRAARDNYYLRAAEHGEPAGVWIGRGAESLGLTEEVTREQMLALYNGLAHPQTGEQLGSAPRQYQSTPEKLAALLAAEPDATPERREQLELQARKDHREARHYVDLTFSAPKSWSVAHMTLEAHGRHEEAEQVWAAWMDGVHAALEYIQQEAGYGRAGKAGCRSLDAHDFVMSAWRHHTSRSGDPQMHVHVAAVNRVKNSDGKWRALDGKGIYRVRPAAEAIVHRVAEQSLYRRTSMRVATRPDGAAREIVGVDPQVCDHFSSRKRAISAEVAELAAAYQEKYGAAPRAYQLNLMAEHATVKTRARKLTHPPSRAEMLAEWQRSTEAKLGKRLDQVLDELDQARQQADRPPAVLDPERVIDQAMAQVDRSKTTWTRYDLIGQLDRYLPDELRDLDARTATALLDELADKALKGTEVTCLSAPELVAAPPELRREDGYSLWQSHRAEQYATTAQLDREERLVAIAHTTGGMRLDDATVNSQLQNSVLSPEQANIAREILTSNRRVEVLVGPAGAGKTTTIGEIAHLWEMHDGAVVGVTVAQNAAEVLNEQGIAAAINSDRFLNLQNRIAADKASPDERGPFELSPRTLVVVDEASMMTTPDLCKVVELSHRAGGKVLVTGDDRQLGAVGAGGGMRLLVREVGSHDLSEVRRFDAEWERAASLRLRDGDVTVLADYDRRGRLIEGTEEEVCTAARDAFLADHLSGRRALLVTSTNEKAAQLSSEIRAELVLRGVVEDQGVPLHSATLAASGDLIQTRHNDRTITDSDGRYVVNRDVYLVTERLDDGRLKVRRQRDAEELGPELTLPAEYVRQHVELAYASTAHAAQGRTVQNCYGLVDEGTTRAGLYVQMTRGTALNIAYTVTQREAADGQQSVETDRFALLAEILERDDVDRPATEVLRDELQASESLARLGPIWADCVAEDARQRYGRMVEVALGKERAQALQQDEAAGALWRLVRGAELDGHDPQQLLWQAIGSRELRSAHSVAEVIHHRIDKQLDQQPSQVETTFAERTPGAHQLGGRTEFGDYARELAVAMDRRKRELGERTAQERPEWSKQFGAVPQEPLDRAQWTHRAAAVAAYREQYGYESPTDPIGPAPPRGGDPHRRLAWHEAWQALGRPEKQRDVASRSDGELANLVEAYRREEAWAPPYVADKLREAHLSARHWQQRADLIAERFDVRNGSDAEWFAARGLAHRQQRRVEQLEQINAAREAWHEHTADSRELAQQAKADLRRRHPDRDFDEPQTEGSRHPKPANVPEANREDDFASAIARAKKALDEIDTRHARARSEAAHERLAEEARRNSYYDRQRSQAMQQDRGRGFER